MIGFPPAPRRALESRCAPRCCTAVEQLASIPRFACGIAVPRSADSLICSVRHGFVPDAARGAVLGDLLEEIIVRVKEKGKLRHKLIHVETPAHSPFDV